MIVASIIIISAIFLGLELHLLFEFQGHFFAPEVGLDPEQCDYEK